MTNIPQKQSKKLRVRLRSYDPRLLDRATGDMVGAAKASGAKISGPIPLPTGIEKITVLRSPHVDRKSRDQFESRTHTRLLEIEVTASTADRFKHLNIAAGVEIITEAV